MTGVDRMAVAFARLLRGAGLDVALGSVTTFAEALGVVGVDRRAAVYWAGRATLVRRPEDIPAYDRAFRRLLARPSQWTQPTAGISRGQ